MYSFSLSFRFLRKVSYLSRSNYYSIVYQFSLTLSSAIKIGPLKNILCAPVFQSYKKHRLKVHISQFQVVSFCKNQLYETLLTSLARVDGITSLP